MKPEDIKRYYRSLYNFNKKTGMSCMSLHNWLKWGYVPIVSQYNLEYITDGELKASTEDLDLPRFGYAKEKSKD